MNMLKRMFLLAACIMMIFSLVPAEANIPYATYTYDIEGTYVESPHAYVPYEIITATSLGMTNKLEDPQDMLTKKFRKTLLGMVTSIFQTQTLKKASLV